MGTFWSDAKASPKLSYRWIATIGSSTTPIQTYTLLKFQKPSFEVHVSEYININDAAYKPGMLTWNPIEIVLVDAETPLENNTRQVDAMMKQSGYRIASHSTPMAAIIKSSASKALGGQITFTQIDADNRAYEFWTLHKPWITKADFGRATYGSDEIATVNLTIRYDVAKYTNLAAALGG